MCLPKELEEAPTLEDAEGKCRVQIAVPDYWYVTDTTNHCDAIRDKTFEHCRFDKAALGLIVKIAGRAKPGVIFMAAITGQRVTDHGVENSRSCCRDGILDRTV